MEKTFSPKEVAKALGVSESSLKRWCDKGRLSMQKTPGGHRRIALSSIIDFIKQEALEIENPVVLGLSPDLTPTRIHDSPHELIFTSLLAGEEKTVHTACADLYTKGTLLWDLFDKYLAPVFHQIGALWECQEIEIFHERRACEIALRFLRVLRSWQNEPNPDAKKALGGTLAGDIYQLPLAMAELTLREKGYAATSLGSNLPSETLCQALKDERPDLFFLSVSWVASKEDFWQQYDGLQETAKQVNTELVIGGQALTTEIRRPLRFDYFGDSMYHLAAYCDG